MVVVSQSGETADTLAALRYARAQGQHTLAIVNVETSTIARESEIVAKTLAGPEIGVASTKAFTCQLIVFACLAIALGRARNVLSIEQERELVSQLIAAPAQMSEALREERQVEPVARDVARAESVLYLGRGPAFPLAMEGALKLKELSYIHAEGYAAGELKHGPIALIDYAMPVIVLAPRARAAARRSCGSRARSRSIEGMAIPGRPASIDPRWSEIKRESSIFTLYRVLGIIEESIFIVMTLYTGRGVTSAAPRRGSTHVATHVEGRGPPTGRRGALHR